MANYFACMCLMRIVLPISLSLSVLFRQTGLSFIYLLLLLLLPMVRIPTHKTMAGATGQYLRAVMVLSFLTSVTQLVFQIVLLSLPPYGSFLEGDAEPQNVEGSPENSETRLMLPGKTDTLETILRHIGLVRLNGLRAEDVVRYIGPEVLMLITSIAVYVGCTKLSAEVVRSRTSSASAPSTAAILPPLTSTVAYRNRRKAFFITVGKCLALASLCVAGILRPAALNGIYFIAFLGGMTWWACYKELRRPFGIVLHCVQVVAALHIMALFIVQLQWVQKFLTADCNVCRYLGLTFLVQADKLNPRQLDFTNVVWTSFLNPVALLWLYYILGIESYFLLRPQERRNEEYSNVDGIRRIPISRQISIRFSQQRKLTLSRNTTNRWRSATQKVRVNSYEADDNAVNEHTHLIRNMSPTKYDGTGRRQSTVRQDAHGSVILSDGYEDVIQLDALGASRELTDIRCTVPRKEENQQGLCEQVLDFFSSLFRIINRSSYIGTNIIMMAWSITYHSWLTFILLLWASFLWILPNQRRSMMRCSPFLVVYAIFLLLAQYIYSMDLREDELPEDVKGVNLRQIGFAKPTGLPCEPLLVKSLYTLFFWITLRQFMQERFERRNTSALEDLAAPLQISVGPATQGFTNAEPPKQSSQAMNWLSDFVKGLLTKFWIWVVAIMLFVIGLSGTRMTVYRIIYMALFLLFVLVFQLSYQAWRKFMYGFWLTVIIYSMSILVLIYTYQFDSFPDYWADYLHISKSLQQDIGLEKYETSQLFVKLLTPTFFLVITVIQMHYFHKDFLALTDIKCRSEILKRESSMYGSSVAGGQGHVTEDPEGGREEQQKEESVPMPSLRTLKQLSTKELQQLAVQFKIQLEKVIDLLWLFLELHMLKMMLLSIMLLCVYDVCAMHFILLLLAVVALSFGSNTHTLVCHVVSVLVSILVLLKMIYQINHFQHQNYDVNCTGNITKGNDADWLGMYKSSSTHTLPEILKGYIGLIFLATLMAIVRVRQLYKRQLSGESISRPHIMFPNIQRCHADQDLRNCFKYLLNYGFYKFGVEICLMATVALIGTRMDLYAVLYGIWLCVLVMMKRETLAKIWGVYQVFIVMLIPIQYAMAVGLPPILCIEYPWDESPVLRSLQEWMFLPDPLYSPAAYKLVCDFVLLMLVCRQSLVFRIERRYAGQVYAGGSNKSILKETEQPGFVNPVPDHISYIRSWLDIAKRCFLSSFLWVTLAIVFLAGTNRVNLFSLGYLVGAFVFLWQGEEIYLRPVPYILKRWNTLLGYNVAIIMIKALLQIVGCMFLMEVKTHACWAAQLLGITCIRKFPAPEVPGFFPMEDPTQCNVPKENSGLIWDGVCFGCLIMMRRLFNSYYFIHQINENKAMTVLASRGAELIEELRMKRIREQENQEHRILEKIRVKMERIKATQQKIQGPMFKEPESHTVAAPLAQSPGMSSPASPQGYHTPIDDEDEGNLPPLTPRGAGSLLQAPTPSSAIMTVSLDGYLEPQRMSFSSPPTSELIPRAPSLDMDSFPVFSPPPYGAVVGRGGTTGSSLGGGHRRQSSIGPPWMPPLATPRPSVCLSSPQSHHTSAPVSPRQRQKSNRDAIRSGDYYMFEELDDDVLEEKDETSSDDEGGRHDGERRVTLSKFLDTAFKTDMEQAAELALNKGTTEEEVADGGRRPSVKLTRNKSSFFTAETEITPQAQASSPSLRSDYGVPTSPDGSKGSYPSQHYPQDEVDAVSTTKDASSETEVKVSIGQRIWLMVKFAWAFVESAMVTLTRRLNHISRDYRYVMEVLTLEKKMLKEKPDFGQGVRVGSSMIWQPTPSAVERSKLSAEDQAGGTGNGTQPETSASQTDRLEPAPSPAKASTSLDHIDESTPEEAEPLNRPLVWAEDILSIPEIRVLAPSLERGLDLSDVGSQQPPVSLEQMDETQELSAKDQAPIVRLMLALWFAIISHSDLVCYFMVFLYQIKSATILSLPLPLMVFLWGTLTIPRPTKTFWVTMIAYTEVIVIVKWMFQFEFLPWNKTEVIDKNPFFPPRIIGIESKPNYAMYDLFLLLIVFFHRYMLKSLGLWKTTYEDPVMFKEKEQKYRLETDGESVGLQRVDEEGTITSEGGPPTGKEIAILKHGGDSRLSYSAPGLGGSGSSQFGRGSSLRRRSSAGNVSDQVVTQGGRRLSAYKMSVDQSEAGEPGGRLAEDEPSASNLIVVRTDEEDASDHIPGFLIVASKRYCDSVKGFFDHLLSRAQRVTADVYALMFLCDFFNFMVVIFGFASFGSDLGEGGVSAYLEENKVPIPFLVMLILQFALIVVDRALYLRKYILGKIVFQFLLVVGVHIWMFFILPLVTDKQFNAELPPQMWYMVKCFYLLLSAYQIRSGYPTRILGNVLCKRYNVLNMVFFKGFMAVPFLFELRALMDWMWTDTSMTVWDWLKMEDIFANIFQHKCARRMESEYPQPRGEKKKPLVKYLMGGGGLFVIIAVIWFPLVIFALGSTVGQPNLPYDVTVTMDIGNYQPIYEMSAQNNTYNKIDKMSEQLWNKMNNAYIKNKAALTFLSNYDHTDIAIIRMSNASRMVWGISEPDKKYLIADLQSKKEIVMRFTWHVSRSNPNPKTTGEATDSRLFILQAEVEGKPNPQRQNLLKMLNGTQTTSLIPNIFPKFLKVTNRGKATPVTQLMEAVVSPDDVAFRNLSLRYNGMNRSSSQSWWSLSETCNDYNYEAFLKKIDEDQCSDLVMYTFNDKSFPKTLSFISGEGIIGLYVGLVLLFSKIIRSIMTGLLEKIMFNDLPNVDRILQLCLDIYLVRESGELDLEEDLFAKLVFLYRSPETLIKWTRPREEGEPEEGNAQPMIGQ